MENALSARRLLAALGFCFAATRAEAQPRHYYVPLVHAVSGEEVFEPGVVVQTQWVGSVSAFNSGTAPANVQPVAAYGGYTLPPAGARQYQLPPAGGWSLFRLPWAAFNDPSSPGPLGFAELVADPGIVISAGVERAQLHCGCSNPEILGCVLVSQGRAPIPVFQELFPAGAKAVCGDVNLGAPKQTCGDPPGQKYLRRVNVTLFNGGNLPATFSISAIPLTGSSSPLYETSVTLSPKEVRQLNAVPIPVVTTNETRSGYDVFVWITISATQPFLAYVSTVFEDGAPGSMPFEVFAPKLAPLAQ